MNARATLPHLSKTRFTTGLQCHKLLWWTVNEREAEELEVDRALEAVFRQGSRVGEVAREYVPGGVLIDVSHDDFDGRIAATREAIEAGARVIYEAAFSADGVFVAVDILEKTRRGWGWRVIEVKSTLSVKEQHIPDLAVQVHIVRASGLDVAGAEVMFLNRECRYPDLSNLFVREDHSADVEALLPEIKRQIRAQRKMLAGCLPVVETGAHCEKPYLCSFYDRCHEPLADYHVSTLYRVSQRRVEEFIDAGFETIGELPESFDLNAMHHRQRRAVVGGGTVVEPGLAEALDEFVLPMAFLDFESVNPAIPVWKGCGPYAAVAVQFSCHVVDARGKARHFEWIADGPEDPRPALASALLEATRGIERVVTWNASFEKQCILGMADAVPKRARELRALAGRLVDLLPVVRDHVYHPEFDGGFSLKVVLPALVAGLSHSDLEISEGNVASAELSRMMFMPESVTVVERVALREALLRYCERDTWGLVRLLDVLREEAGREEAQQRG